MNNVSVDEARAIRNEIGAYVKLVAKEYDKDYELYKMDETIACYYLWNLKKDSSIISLSDMVNKIESLKSSQYALILFEDFNGIFLEYDASADSHSGPWNGWKERSNAWENFKGFADKYTEEQLAAAIFKAEFIENDIYEKYFAFAPQEIGKLVDLLLDVNKKESIVEIGASSYILEALERSQQVHIEAYDEDNYTILTLISILADVMGYPDLICRGWSFDEGAEYDKVFVNNKLEPSERLLFSDIQYDLENEWSEFPRDISNEWNMCGAGILRMKDSGKAVAVMNAGQLTLNKYREVREFLCKGGFVEGVILLPDKMYANTWINPYLVIFSKNNKSVKFLDARNEYVATRKRGKRINSLDDEILESIIEKYKSGKACVEVKVDKMEDGDFVLTPNRYVEVNDANVNRVRLGDVVKEIKRGITLSASDMDQMIMDAPSDTKCLLPSDIVAGVVTVKKYFHGKLRKPGKNEAHQGDVLISKTGNPFRIAVADNNYLIVGNTYILDIDREKISPEYVKCYLSSKAGQQEIMKYASGSTTPIISVSNLSSIEIPVHDEATQKELNQHANEVVNALNESYRQIQICEDEIDSLFG